MHAGRGRNKIRPPRRGVGNAEAVDFEANWQSLAESLRKIHTKEASQLSFEALYRNAYKLVLKKKGETLYYKVKEFEEEWLAGEVQPRILEVLSPSLIFAATSGQTITTDNEKVAAGDKLLGALKEAWEDHNLCMNMTTDVLMYMDRVYCKDFRKPSIFAASMSQFREHVLRTPLQLDSDQHTSLAQVLISVVLDQVYMDRKGDMIDRSLVKSCIYMLEGLYETEEEEESFKLYLTSFEPAFLKASEKFYREEGTSILRDADAGTFCRHAKRRLAEEEDRCRSTLSPLTLGKIKAVVETELIKNHLHEVISLTNSGVKHMIDNELISELGMMYDLSARVDPKKEELRRAVQARVVEQGTEINKATEAALKAPPRPSAPNGGKLDEEEKTTEKEKPLNQQTTAAIQWVDDVIALKQKYDTILTEAFQDDQGLQTALSRSFTDFINIFERSSEYLSLFFDENMKKGIKGKTENEVDMLLDKGITLLRYIQDKDMFERYYKKHLSKRLLMKRSISMDAERQMISKMKMEVGNTFTQRIEAMFKDMSVSEDLSRQYRTHVSQLGDRDPTRAEIDVNVLTSTMWPLEAMAPSYNDGEERPKCIFPTQIDRIRQGFEKFYLDKHSGRALTWQANMGTADLRAYFPNMKGTKKTRDINVSTYAMIILLLFNELPAGHSLTCEEIQAQTNMPLNELSRNLQSLALGPTNRRVLLKEPMSRDVKLSDTFLFNEGFYSPYQKFKISTVASGNKVEDSIERSETEKKNNDTRGGVIEAAIVRVMKQRKELAHQKLIAEVIHQLNTRFLPDVSMVKKRIESLIEREYLERIEEREPQAYKYLA
ncbi:cullin 3, partial [Lecanoromycetidae sp. Uapishka_2]